MQDSIYHMTLKSPFISKFCTKKKKKKKKQQQKNTRFRR